MLSIYAFVIAWIYPKRTGICLEVIRDGICDENLHIDDRWQQLDQLKHPDVKIDFLPMDIFSPELGALAAERLQSVVDNRSEHFS